MEKLKVLQFPIANSNGGITHYAVENWKRMNEDRFQCDFATMSKQLDFEDEILSMGSKIHYISCYAEDGREQFISEFNKILDEGYDVVHLHTKQWKSLLAEELCRKHHVPKVIIHAHSAGIDVMDPNRRKAEEQLHEQVKQTLHETAATNFWACSMAAADFIFGGQIAKEKIEIMPNAIELGRFAFNKEIRSQYRENCGYDGCFVIGHAGRFEYQKNHEFLIDVFYELAQIIDRARLILLGDGQLVSDIQKKVRKLGIEDKVLFLGKRDDISSWYQAMDVFCLPSRFEGLPISMIEAQASGLPCIGSGSITAEVQVCRNVYLLPFEKRLYVDCLIKMQDIKRQGKENQIQLARQGYDIKTQIQRIEQGYRV